MIQQCSSCSRCSSLIISQWSISVLMHAMRSWGSSPSLATTPLSSLRHTWVLTLCVIPCWIWSRKAEAFALVAFCSSSLPVGIHCVCVHLQGFGSQGCKDISQVVLTVQHDAVEEDPVLQGMLKYGEGVVGIFGVPVVGRQADGCSSGSKYTDNGISCGLGRLGDQLLWSWFWGHVSGAGWSDNGQIRKNRGRIQKCLYLGNHQSYLLQTWTECSWGCLCWWHHGVHMGAQKMASELWGYLLCIIFLPKHWKQGKI